MENKNEAASNVKLTSEQRTCSYCDNLKRRLSRISPCQTISMILGKSSNFSNPE